jgi:putative ABC transport system permease protein
MSAFSVDLRAALRTLRRHRGFVVGSAATLALGIGAVTTLVSALDVLLLRPPAGVSAPDRVVRPYFQVMDPQLGDWTASTVTYPDFTDLQLGSSFAAVAPVFTQSSSLGRGADATPVNLAAVTGRFFQILGTSPLAGRLLEPADDRIDRAEVAVLSERLWRSHFGADPATVGRTLPIDGRAYTVVGIAPRGFDAGEYEAADLWVPLSPIARTLSDGGDSYRTSGGWLFLKLLARLQPAATNLLLARGVTRAREFAIRKTLVWSSEMVSG